MTKPLLRIEGLEKSFEVPVLRSLNLEIFPGQSVALVGANGAGKSTLIKIILGLVRADAGLLELWGDPTGPKSLSRVGYLPEVAGFWPELSARELLTYSSRIMGLESGRAEQRIASLLAVLGLKNRGDRKIGGYSKGMSQRTGLARLLLRDPDFLILDEPMSGLDPRAQAKVRQIILRLREQGKSFLISSHSLEDIEKLCDRVLVLEKGAKVMDGHTQEVLKELQSKYESSEPWDEDPLGDESDIF